MDGGGTTGVSFLDSGLQATARAISANIVAKIKFCFISFYI
jgi:hypothetical protein